MIERAWMCVGVLVLAAGCSEDPPDPTGGGEGGQAATSDPRQRTPIEPQPKRTLLQRNPFGNVAASQNLLWDGDFEWASPFTDQYGWFEPPLNPTLSDVVVGPACRSGVKCARVKKGGDVVGIAVGSSERALAASVWTRFELEPGDEAPSCSQAVAVMIDDGSLVGDEDVGLSPEGVADEQGWCKHSALVPVRAHKPYLFVANASELPMLVDDAVILAEAALLAEAAIDPQPATGQLVPASLRARVDRARAAARALRRPADGKPNAAREAFERHKQEQRRGTR